MVRLAEYISRAAVYAVSVIVMVFSPFSVIVVSPFTVTGVVMFLFSQVTLPEMVSSSASAAIRDIACSVPLQAERSASSAAQTGQSGSTAPCSQWVSQLHSAGAFPGAVDTSVSTADAGTPGIVKIIAAASKNAAGRCWILPPAADIPSQALPKRCPPAACGFGVQILPDR